MNRSLLITLLLCTAALAVSGCGGRHTTTAELASPVPALETTDATAPATVEVSTADGRITASLPAPVADVRFSLPVEGIKSLELAPEMTGKFLMVAVEDAGRIEVVISGIRRCDAAEVAATLDRQELDRLLNDRWELNGEVELCTINTAGGSTGDLFTIEKWASLIGDTDQVEGVKVLLTDDGGYEVSWPAFLTADYNQDGLVGVSDLVPLGMLYGMSQAAESNVWLVDAYARVDGNHDGLINVSDITPLGQNYGNSNFNFRVERSLGDASGPGTTWEAIGTVNRSGVTSTGETVTGTSRAAYQRYATELQPGWAYYRVTALSNSSPEADPSAAVLGPDGTPPEWPDEEIITSVVLDPSNFYIVDYDPDATDDRGGEVSYGIQLTGGADPDEQVVMLEYNTKTSVDPFSDPCEMGFVYVGDPPTSRYPGFIQDEQYWVRARVNDESGNEHCSAWFGFNAEINTALESRFDLGDGYDQEIWVNREGTVKFTPMPCTTYWGMSPEIWIYVQAVPWDTDVSGSDVEDYEGIEPFRYTGGEVVLEGTLGPTQRLNVLVQYEFWDGKVREKYNSVYYPYYWLKPLSESAYASASIAEQCDYLSDGTPFCVFYIEPDRCIVTFKAGTAILTTVDQLVWDPARSLRYPPTAIESTGEIAFHELTGLQDPGYVVWFKPGEGKTGYAEEPTGVFSLTLQDFILQWVLEDQDTLVGVRSIVQEDAEDNAYLEVWEARRDDGIYLRTEIPVPEELERSWGSSSMLLKTIGPDGELVIMEYMSTGALSYDQYYHHITTDGTWTTISLETFPATFPTSDWESNQVTDFEVNSDLTVYASVLSVNKNESDEVVDKFMGIYYGNLLEGVESFNLLVANTMSGGFNSEYPAVADGERPHLIPPFDGTAYFSGSPHYHLTDSAGNVLGYYGPDAPMGPARYNFDECDGYFDRAGAQPALANGLLSEDGEWLCVGAEGVWGLAYRIPGH